MDTPRVVVITGATRGIGRALTDRLVELGHTVIGC
ncbi:MAG: SDR family NAD(P)-dependent oxidoreductase, partial [Acidobacteria bacterium]|nr:SDR family NAD(P)-dependent oxidoreductase [Candidatus Sulfomarinibacter kjeldsenii]